MSDPQPPTDDPQIPPTLWSRFNPFRRRKRGRWAKIRRGVFTVALLAYLFLMTFPNVLFAHQVTHGRFHVYSNRPIDPAIVGVLDEATALLGRSELNRPEMDHHVYLCDNPALRRFLSPTTYAAFGATFPLLGHTVMNRSDIAANRVYNSGRTNNERPLSAVIAHERTHSLMNRRFGSIECLMMPLWKREGYCDYVGGGLSFPVDEAKRLIAAGLEDPAPSFKYARGYLMIKYLIEVEGKSIDQVVSGHFDEEEVLASVRSNLDRL